VAKTQQSEHQLIDGEAVADYLDERGKKGIQISRYKGLGEMNADELWETTMNPDARTLLQVKVDDAVKTDELFTILMGDQVEPRRQFIEQNALQVKNLDIQSGARRLAGRLPLVPLRGGHAALASGCHANRPDDDKGPGSSALGGGSGQPARKPRAVPGAPRPGAR